MCVVSGRYAPIGGVDISVFTGVLSDEMALALLHVWGAPRHEGYRDYRQGLNYLRSWLLSGDSCVRDGRDDVAGVLLWLKRLFSVVDGSDTFHARVLYVLLSVVYLELSLSVCGVARGGVVLEWERILMDDLEAMLRDYDWVFHGDVRDGAV